MAIRLTENRLRRIIKESIRKKLTEALSDNGISVSNEEIVQKLKNGENPDDIFTFVGQILKDGYATVKLNNKWNFIDKQGNLLSNQWLDYAHDFCNGFAVIGEKNKHGYNLMDTQGNILSKQWFSWVGDFDNNGFSAVEKNGKFNYINNQGNILSKYWFDKASGFLNNGPYKGYQQLVTF